MKVLGLTITACAAELPEGSVSAARAGSDCHEQPQDLLSSWLVGDWGLGGFCIHLWRAESAALAQQLQCYGCDGHC